MVNSPDFWQGTAQSTGLAALGGAAVVLGLVLVAAGAGLLGGTAPGLAGALLITSSRLRMVVDRRGVRVHWGPLGVPVNRIKLANITDAKAVAIRPLHAGGWGYRGSRLLFHSAAAVVRRGPAIRLELAGGRIFVITVDDAATGTTVLQGLLEERTV